MGITQHRDAVDGVRAIVNLGLARGNVGRDGAGLMPIRGHSGVQGGAEMGAYATALPGGAPVDPRQRRGARRGVGLPRARRARGSPRPRWSSAAAAGDLDVLWTSGGNFLDVLPDPPSVAAALDGCRCGSTRTSCSPPRCSSTATTWSCCRWPPATSRRAAAPRPPPSGASSSARRSPARSARPAASGGCSPTWPSRVRPELAGRVLVADQPATCGPRSPRWCPCTPASRRWPTRATRCSGAGGTCCAGGDFPTPSGRGRFTAARPRRRRGARRDVHGGHPAGQAVQLDGARGRSTR